MSDDAPRLASREELVFELARRLEELRRAELELKPQRGLWGPSVEHDCRAVLDLIDGIIQTSGTSTDRRKKLAIALRDMASKWSECASPERDLLLKAASELSNPLRS